MSKRRGQGYTSLRKKCVCNGAFGEWRNKYHLGKNSGSFKHWGCLTKRMAQRFRWLMAKPEHLMML